MKYIAIIRRNGNLAITEGIHGTKKSFREDLRGNGISVKAIYTEEQISTIKTKDCCDITEVEEYVQQVL